MTTDRTLSDADVQAIVDAMEVRLTRRFYLNLGRGVWGLVWRGVLGVLLLLAAYGAGQHLK
jgi:hypothetical protein